MNIARTSSTFAALATVLIAACAQQTEVLKLYDNSARAGQKYERVLVISVVGDTGLRRRLEELVSSHLESARVTAIPGYTETGLKTEMLQEEIDDAARNANADAILITHIVSVDTRVDLDPGRTDISTECRGGDPVDYFLYNHRELKEPDSVKIAHTVVAVTSLYDASDGERLWTIQSTCFEKSSMDEVLQEEAKAIVRQLQIDNLVG
jgi:hypothetical protein